MAKNKIHKNQWWSIADTIRVFDVFLQILRWYTIDEPCALMEIGVFQIQIAIIATN